VITRLRNSDSNTGVYTVNPETGGELLGVPMNSSGHGRTPAFSTGWSCMGDRGRRGDGWNSMELHVRDS